MKLNALAVAGIGSCLRGRRRQIVRFVPESGEGSASIVVSV
jgi:hypothetical protein